MTLLDLLATATDTATPTWPLLPSTGTPQSLVRHVPGSAPLVLDSPHSGTYYPADFLPACPLGELRRAEDTHVDRLFAFVTTRGIAWVEALFPRSYLDANRALSELDVALLDAPWPEELPRPTDGSKMRLGKGLIWRLTDDGRPIYDRLLSVEEVRARIDRCWHPYQEAVANAVRDAKAQHGYCIHLNCHSMPSVAGSHATNFPGMRHPDFVIGDRHGTTADRRLSERICRFLRHAGYEVSYNDPYKGVEIVRRHSDPLRHVHSIQLEINRRLYMNETTLDIHGDAFEALQSLLRELVSHLLAVDPR